MDALARCAKRGCPTDVVAAQVRLVASIGATVDASQFNASVLVAEAVEYPPRTGRAPSTAARIGCQRPDMSSPISGRESMLRRRRRH